MCIIYVNFLGKYRNITFSFGNPVSHNAFASRLRLWLLLSSVTVGNVAAQSCRASTPYLTHLLLLASSYGYPNGPPPRPSVGTN